MKFKLLFLSFFFFIAACTSPAEPGSSLASTQTIPEPTKSIAPLLLPTAPSILFIDPLYVPTPVNTPHVIPTELGQVDLSKIGDINNARFDAFENTLRFEIKIIEVGFERSGKNRFVVITEGKLTNITNRPIVVRKSLKSDFTYNEDVSWRLHLGKDELFYEICCVDTFSLLTRDDFVTLQPGEFQIYSFVLTIPKVLHDDNSTDVALSGNNINLVAGYRNFQAGFIEYSNDPKYVDMNAWVGSIQSNSVERVFP